MADRPRRGPVPALIGVPLTPLYAWAVARRNKRFDKGLGQTTPPVPVVSVGNISAGGAGKSPMVRWGVAALRAAGWRPGILLRGYGPHEAGLSDEQAEHRLRCPGVNVHANPNRALGVAEMLGDPVAPRTDCVVLDDGFQHRQIRRHFDLVLVDATRSPFDDRLLPAGWLREPPSSLARASAVVLTRADQAPAAAVNDLRARIEQVAGAPPLALTRHAWADQIELLLERRETSRPRDWLKGKRLLVTCAIGNPDAFVSEAFRQGATVAETIALRDHARFTEPQVDRIIKAATETGADAVLCTSKDWMKLRRVPADRWPCPVARPVVEIDVIEGREELTQRLLDAVAGATRRRRAPAATTQPAPPANDQA